MTDYESIAAAILAPTTNVGSRVRAKCAPPLVEDLEQAIAAVIQDECEKLAGERGRLFEYVMVTIQFDKSNAVDDYVYPRADAIDDAIDVMTGGAPCPESVAALAEYDRVYRELPDA